MSAKNVRDRIQAICQHIRDHAAFTLLGGKYGLDISGTWSSGNAQVETLSIDGSTWLNVGSSVSANGVSVLELPAGQYRVAVSGSASAVYFP